MSSKQAPSFKVNLLDLATILYHVHRGSQMEEHVGFEDCERTLAELTEELTPLRAKVDLRALESALWSCNLMDEVGEFWSVRNESFDDFIKRLLRYASTDERYEFDKFYNQLRVRVSQRGTLEKKLVDAIDEARHDDCNGKD